MLALALWTVLVYAPSSGGAAGERARVTEALARELLARGERVLDGNEAIAQAQARRAEGWTDAAHLEFFARARALVDEGRRMLERVELEKAERAFGEAEKIYEQELVRPGVAALWARAALWRGVARFELGRPEAAASFRRAVALERSTVLTDQVVRPDVARAFAQATRPRGKIRFTVEGDPSGAEIRIDGVARGQSPLGIELDEREHLVEAKQPGRVPDAFLCDAPGVSLGLQADDRAAELAALAERPSTLGTEVLIDALDLDGVVVAAVSRDAGELVLVGARANAGECATLPSTVSFQGANLASAAAALIDRVRKSSPHCPGVVERVVEAPKVAHPRPAPTVEKKPPPPPKKPKFWERPWLWIGLLAVTTASVAVAAALAPTETTYRARVNPDDFTRWIASRFSSDLHGGFAPSPSAQPRGPLPVSGATPRRRWLRSLDSFTR